MRCLAWCLLALGLTACPRPSSQPAPIRVAAASDLAIALEQMREPFEQKSGQKLEIILGSSGKLARLLVE